MIDRISQKNQFNSKHTRPVTNDKKSDSPSFTGSENGMLKKCGESMLKGIQKCEKNPMLNVAIIDLATAIIPRSIWESFTNIFAGFEALRRESSGLIVNCLLPGFVALGAGKLINKVVMGPKSDMSGCWAGHDSINTISDYYTNAESTQAFQDGMAKFNDTQKAKVYATHYNMLSDASGFDGDARRTFKDISELDIAKSAEELTEATFEQPKKLTITQRLGNIFKERPQSKVERTYCDIASKTHITENVKFGAGEKTVTTDLKSAIKNTTSMLRGFIADGVENAEQVEAFTKKAKKLVNGKSAIAMAIVIPLAASMQSINRWITTKMSGVEGAPIYKDYTEQKEKVQKTPEEEKADKKALIKQKIISVGSMVGVACLSMMKLPTLSTLKNIFQFKGQFPTMDQARAISTVTFGSRMAVADDKNELKEATTRDIVTFSSMYFLGDYAAKGYATYLENKDGVKLLNRTKPIDKNANPLKKFGNWIVNTHLKSTDELVADGVRSLEDMKKLRAKCQVANLGSALLILGAIVPIYTRLVTNKNHKKELENGHAQNVNKNVNFVTKSSKNDFSGTLYGYNTFISMDPAFESFRKRITERNYAS